MIYLSCNFLDLLNIPILSLWGRYYQLYHSEDEANKYSRKEFCYKSLSIKIVGLNLFKQSFLFKYLSRWCNVKDVTTTNNNKNCDKILKTTILLDMKDKQTMHLWLLEHGSGVNRFSYYYAAFVFNTSITPNSLLLKICCMPSLLGSRESLKRLT